MTEECANPLLLKWIKEWYDQARERNSKGVTTYVFTRIRIGYSELTTSLQIQEGL